MTSAPAAWPLAEFEEVFARASRAAPFDPTAVALATADARGSHMACDFQPRRLAPSWPA